MPLSDTTPLPNTQVPTPRVLVVDDEAPVRTVARLMLERLGHAVEEAGTAAEALARAAGSERPFSVVLLDVSLADRSGIDLLHDLRLLTARTRVILMSGRPEGDYPDHGADGFLAKPFSRDQLVAAVRAVAALAPR